MRPTGRSSSARARRRSRARTGTRPGWSRFSSIWGVHVESSTALGRLRRLELSPTRFLQLTLISLGALWLIVLTGAAVRVTDSGLGCRHWPGCEAGHPLPAKDYPAFIEIGNRVFGGVTILITLFVAVAAVWTPLG